MARPIAICPNCGNVFEDTRFKIENSFDMTIVDAYIPCPKCQEIAQTPDGNYDFTDEEINYRGLYNEPSEKIELINKLLRHANFRTKEELIQGIHEISPSAATYAQDFIRHKEESTGSAMSVKDMIAALLVIFAVILTGCSPSRVAQNKSFQENNIETNKTVKNNILIGRKIDIKDLKQPAKNALCSCGSGKIYKRCHGLSAEERRDSEIKSISEDIKDIRKRNR
ncbi:YecA family protein [Sphingobacterium puteale]|uniref:YecA family protein n=1 Tax=Sphingobacterium puteale TaxID=2420510 RepID=UPI003D95F3AA